MSNPFVGNWTYRSFLNDPDLHVGKDGDPDFNAVMFGYGTLTIQETAPEQMGGRIGGEGWSLELQGSMTGGYPGQVRFQGRGVVSGSEWVYDYLGWLVPAWPNGVEQVPAIVGTIVRTVKHPSSGGGTSPAGVVASWYAVREG